MKLSSTKFGFALGIALSIAFLFCNIVFGIIGKDLSLRIVNTLFHNMDFSSLMVSNDFSIGKLICGMLVVFIEGYLIGCITSAIYNIMSKEAK